MVRYTKQYYMGVICVNILYVYIYIITGGGGGMKSNQSTRSISPAMIPCGISDEQLVTLTVRELNKQLKMRGLNKEEMGTMKQR